MMRRLLKIELSWAFSRAFTKFGIAIAANNPMMATTIMISTRVKPDLLFVLFCITLLSFFLSHGVNKAEGGLLLLLTMFTDCLLQPRCSNSSKPNATVSFKKNPKELCGGHGESPSPASDHANRVPGVALKWTKQKLDRNRSFSDL